MKLTPKNVKDIWPKKIVKKKDMTKKNVYVKKIVIVIIVYKQNYIKSKLKRYE